jgi:hypothetical protein
VVWIICTIYIAVQHNGILRENPGFQSANSLIKPKFAHFGGIGLISRKKLDACSGFP